jgi:Tol biopolymer transport system component
MKADGTGQRRLTRSANADDLLPHWSSDGRQIAFTSMRRDGSERLLVVPTAGGAQSFLALGAEASLQRSAS